MTELDYRELLVKYMRHVVEVEGSTFVDYLNDAGRGATVEFIQAEIEALRAVEVRIARD